MERDKKRLEQNVPNANISKKLYNNKKQVAKIASLERSGRLFNVGI